MKPIKPVRAWAVYDKNNRVEFLTTKKVVAINKRPAKIQGGVIFDQGFNSGISTAIEILKGME